MINPAFDPVVMRIAIKSYIATSLRLTNELLEQTQAKAEKEQLSAIIVGLQIALDQFTNTYE